MDGRDTILVKLMSASSLRARVLSENIANQNVPGYTRRVVRFEELLQQQAARGADLSRVAPRVETDALTPASPDGNNVNLELETNALRENWLLYQLYAQMLESRHDLIRSAIQEGR